MEKKTTSTMIPLWKIPRNTRIRFENGEEINFHHVDGMYSYCVDDNGLVYHFSATTLAEVVNV